jgi:hypothetical protein
LWKALCGISATRQSGHGSDPAREFFRLNSLRLPIPSPPPRQRQGSPSGEAATLLESGRKKLLRPE